jgi:antitoxin component YwqK of YwqJK toxin-antitoxin module
MIKKIILIFSLIVLLGYGIYFVMLNTFSGYSNNGQKTMVFILNNTRYDIYNFKKLNGKIVKDYNSGVHWIQNVKNGKREGVRTVYYESGEKLAQTYFVNDIIEGKAIGWHKNLNLMFKGQYKNGKKHGMWSRWHSNGLKFKETTFFNGKINGHLIIWYKNGKLRLDSMFKNGVKNGEFKRFSKDGKLLEMVIFKNAKKIKE